MVDISNITINKMKELGKEQTASRKGRASNMKECEELLSEFLDVLAEATKTLFEEMSDDEFKNTYDGVDKNGNLIYKITCNSHRTFASYHEDDAIRRWFDKLINFKSKYKAAYENIIDKKEIAPVNIFNRYITRSKRTANRLSDDSSGTESMDDIESQSAKDIYKDIITNNMEAMRGAVGWDKKITPYLAFEEGVVSTQITLRVCINPSKTIK